MKTVKITLVLHNIRSIYNVGAILRTAEGLGIDSVVYSGYTPRYQDAKVLPHLRAKLDRQISKAALGAEAMVPQTATDDLLDLIQDYREQGWQIVGLENNLAAEEVQRRWVLGEEIPKRPTAGASKMRTTTVGVSKTQKMKLGKTGADGSNTTESETKILLVLGEEVHGIPAEIRPELDYFLEIPMCGRKESFNVSVATGIALWGLKNTLL